MTIVLDNSQGGASQESEYSRIQALLTQFNDLFNNYLKPKDCLLRLLFQHVYESV